MQIKKAVSFLVIQLIMLGCRLKVYCLLNIYPQFANIWNSNHVISAKNKCHQKIKDKIYQKKVVLELLCISGQTHHIVILYKQVYSRM
jgi:hypothetical protein